MVSAEVSVSIVKEKIERNINFGGKYNGKILLFQTKNRILYVMQLWLASQNMDTKKRQSMILRWRQVSQKRPFFSILVVNRLSISICLTTAQPK